jgi:hypothetical protein
MMHTLRTILLVIPLVLLSACEEALTGPAGESRNMEDFEEAWSRVKEVYPDLEYKNIDWNGLYDTYEARAARSCGDEIYPVLIEMLGELKDGHVYLKSQGGEVMRTYNPGRWIKDKDSFDPLVVSTYFEAELNITGEGTIAYGILPANIGYIYLGTFDDDYIWKYFPKALDYVKNTTSLILDIRHNNGGSYKNLEAVVSRFITGPLEKPDFYVLGELIPLEPFNPGGSFQYVNEVMVLINGVCFSTGDIFPEIMKQLPNVTLVGDTTGGGSSGSTSSAPAEFELPSGKKIFVGTTDWRGYNGLPLEWVGCAPDIYVPQAKADIEAGRDLQLEAAIRLLVEK